MDELARVAMAIIVITGFPVLIYAGIVGVGALQRRLERRDPPAEMRQELDELRNRLAELEQVQGRVEELEERMDFSERVLTQDHRPEPLKP
jgi:hypothetical protein